MHACIHAFMDVGLAIERGEMQNAETRVQEIGAVDLQSESFTFNRDNIDQLIDAQVDGQQPQSPDTTVQYNDIMWSNEDICRQLDEELHQQLSEELQVVFISFDEVKECVYLAVIVNLLEID